MLNQKQIRNLIEKNKLIENYVNLGYQLTPNGFDLTVGKIFRFKTEGSLDFSNKQRKLSEVEEILPKKENPEDKFGWWDLSPGAYKIRTNERLNLPLDIIGIGFSRSSLLRMGAYTISGVWDAGFSGESEFILKVENPIKIKQNARIIQLIFIKISKTDRGYNGIYQI